MKCNCRWRPLRLSETTAPAQLLLAISRSMRVISMCTGLRRFMWPTTIPICPSGKPTAARKCESACRKICVSTHRQFGFPREVDGITLAPAKSCIQYSQYNRFRPLCHYYFLLRLAFVWRFDTDLAGFQQPCLSSLWVFSRRSFNPVTTAMSSARLPVLANSFLIPSCNSPHY
jgi:hypothetical protein